MTVEAIECDFHWIAIALVVFLFVTDNWTDSPTNNVLTQIIFNFSSFLLEQLKVIFVNIVCNSVYITVLEMLLDNHEDYGSTIYHIF